MKTETLDTFWARIYASGPIEVAKQILRREVLRKGLCVTVDATHFIYTVGEEAGYVVGLIAYPRFPESHEDITQRALYIAEVLLEETYQHSVLVTTPATTFWRTKRDQA